MPSAMWGNQSNMGAGTRTSGGYRGTEYGTGRPRTTQRADIMGKRADQQASALEASQGSAYNDAMAQARAQADAERLLQNSRFNTMMGLKNTMDSMRSGRPNYGTNLQFQNIPAAASMVGMNLPQYDPNQWVGPVVDAREKQGQEQGQE